MKDKTIAVVFAIFLGSLGIHWFYLGKKTRGTIYLLITILSCVTYGISYFIGATTFNWGLMAISMLFLIIPIILCIISFFEGIILLCKNQEEFDNRYNHRVSAVVYGSRPANRQSNLEPQVNHPSKADTLMELKKLLDSGIINQEEFDNEKRKILNQ